MPFALILRLGITFSVKIVQIYKGTYKKYRNKAGWKHTRKLTYGETCQKRKGHKKTNLWRNMAEKKKTQED